MYNVHEIACPVLCEVLTPMTTEHTLEHRGCRLHYWLSGPADRPLVVFTHGATADHDLFTEQVGPTAEHYRVLTWDVRGHGRSRPLAGSFVLQDTAADLLAILDAVGAQRAILVGQSMGGMIHQFFYHQFPERVGAMVMIGSVCIAFAYRKWEVWALKATLPLFDIWPYEHFKKIVAQRNALTPAGRDYMLRAIGQLTRPEFLTIWKAVSLAVDDKGLPGHHIRVPLLITHGDQDTSGTIRRDAPRWAAYEPDAQLVVIPRAAHNANLDNPAFFNQALLDFLAGRVDKTTERATT